MKTLITGKTDEYENILYEEPDENLDEFFGVNTGIKTTSWYEWGLQIKCEVDKIISLERGDNDNAHFIIRFAERLLEEINLLPLSLV